MAQLLLRVLLLSAKTRFWGWGIYNKVQKSRRKARTAKIRKPHTLKIWGFDHKPCPAPEPHTPPHPGSRFVADKTQAFHTAVVGGYSLTRFLPCKTGLVLGSDAMQTFDGWGGSGLGGSEAGFFPVSSSPGLEGGRLTPDNPPTGEEGTGKKMKEHAKPHSVKKTSGLQGGKCYVSETMEQRRPFHAYSGVNVTKAGTQAYSQITHAHKQKPSIFLQREGTIPPPATSHRSPRLVL